MNKLHKKLTKALKLKRSHLIIIGIALTLSIALMSAQRILNTSMRAMLTEKSAELLTADIEIATTEAISSKNITHIESVLTNQKHTKRQIFSSMIQFYGDQSELAEIVAVENEYPLRGECLGIDAENSMQSISTLLGQASNAVVISERLYNETDLTFGSTITIGNFSAVVTGIIKSEPDISIQSLQLGPRIYMSLKNSKETGFDPNLSRKYHSYLIRLDDPEKANTISQELMNVLGIKSDQKTVQGSYGPAQPMVVRNYNDVNESIIEGFDAMHQFFLFLSLFVLLLTGTAFGFIIWTSIIQKLHDIGNLRYLGVSIRQIQTFYKKETVNIAIAATAIGLIVGTILAQIAQWIIGLQMNLAFFIVKINPIDIAFIAIFSVLGIYSMTNSVLKITETNGLFDNEQPQQTNFKIISLISIALFIFMIIFLLLNHIKFNTSMMIIALFFSVFVVLSGLDAGIFSLLKKLPLNAFSLSTRLALKYLCDGHTIRRMAFLSICFSLISILTMAHYEASLNAEFSPKKSNKTLPSIFFIDMYTNQVDGFKTLVPERHTISPMVRTRITKINNELLNEYEKNQGINDSHFLYREQNLSSRKTLYETEKVLEGNWYQANTKDIEISIERRFAKRLKLKLNDSIEFSMLGFPFKGTITSIRSVDWSTFEPNFFMLINPPNLDTLPQTWVGAIYTSSAEETSRIQNLLTVNFPNVSIIDVQKTSEKILGFFKTFILAFKIGAIYCFFIGGLLFILLGKLYSDIREEGYSMLHWIGMGKNRIQAISLIENLWFSGITYICAFSISVIICLILFTFFIPIPLVFNWTSSAIILVLLIGLVTFQWYSKKKNFFKL